VESRRAPAAGEQEIKAEEDHADGGDVVRDAASPAQRPARKRGNAVRRAENAERRTPNGPTSK
jgi:hypothetical protein